MFKSIDKHLDNVNSAQEFEESMPQPPVFLSRYGPNNLVIVPTTVSTEKSSTTPTANLMKLKPRTPQVIEQNVSVKAISRQLNGISSIELKPTPSMDQLESKLSVENVKPTQETPETLEDVNKNIANVENLNKTKKVNSWASNYLQSIGHNNIKPIKITLSSFQNKTQKIETISTQSNESKTVAQPILLKDTLSSYEDLNMTDNPDLSKANEKMVIEHINVGNIKTLHPASVCRSSTNETSDVHVKMAPVPSRCDYTSTPVNSTIMLDTTYSNNNSKALANTITLAKDNDHAKYCYNDRNSNNHQFDILDAIKSKINYEYAVEQKSRAINLHKDMCEEFIKEISNNKPSESERKGNRSKSSTSAKKNEPALSKIKKKHATAKFESKYKKLNVKKEKIILDKESSKTTKNNTTDKERSKNPKHISLEVDKAETIQLHSNKQQAKKPIIDLKDFEKIVDQEKVHFKKQQIKKPLIDLKDFDNLGKHFFDKELEKQPKTQNYSPERQNLKRVHTNSDLLNTSSEIHTHSPIKSVVLVAEKCQNNSPKRQCLEESFDLRSKLSRVNQRIYKRQIENDLTKKSKQRDNIKITVEKQNDEKLKSPKKSGILKYKTKKCKKLKLIINVVCQGSEDETTSSDSSYSETENNPTHNMDLSFLDDINVDEIVDSLKHSPKHKMKSPLPYDCKMQENTKMPAESDVKLATILNMLNVKSEPTKFKTLAKTDCTNVKKPCIYKEENDNKVNWTEDKNTTHDLVKILSQTKLQLQQQKPPPSDDGYLKARCCIPDKELYAGVNISHEDEQRSEDNKRLIIDESVIINEQEITIIDLTDESLCAISETNNITTSTISLKKYSKDKQVVLTTEEVINSVYNSGNCHKDVNKNDSNNKLNNHLNPMISTYPKKNSKSLTAHKMDVETEMAILHKIDESIIDLTKDNVVSNIESNLSTVKTTASAHDKNNITAKNTDKNYKNYMTKIEAVKQQNFKTQLKTKNIVSEILIEQKYLHLIPLPKADIHSPKDMLINTETLIITDEKGIHKNTGNQTGDKKLKENFKVINDNLENKEISIKDNINEESFAMKPVDAEIQVTNEKQINKNTGNQSERGDEKLKEIEKYSNDNADTKEININRESSTTKSVNNDTIMVQKESNTIIKNKEKLKKSVKNIHDTIKETNTAKKDTNKDNFNKNISEVFEKKVALNVVKNIVGNIWDIENKSKDSNDTKTEIQPKSASIIGNNAIIESTSTVNVISEKVKNDPIITGQYKALVSLLEERMLGYLHKEIKIIKHIRLGKYSNIFSCKDSNGQTYAAKVLTNQNNRQVLGIQKEQMLRQLQQDIPRENLNIIYLIDGFGVERYWCFLTEYHPINLQQVLKQRDKPFHLERVQDLARQLISAVIILRNNKIVHSDIKPSHILLNSTNERLKLCGFDSAYYISDMNPLPNIGTVNYRAPEIIIGFSAGYSIDVWSSALVIHEMATNRKLFPGIYNNDILYKQMCTFGNLSRDMVEASPFQNRHFQGRTFMRRVGYKGQDAILFQKFYKTKRLQSSTIAAYNTHWQTKDAFQREADMLKLTALNKLLEQMLLLDPRFRLAIEFVCADPFIYEMFDQRSVRPFKL